MKLKKILVLIITLISIFIINIKRAYALNIKVENIDIINKGDNISLSNDDIKSDIEFNKLDEYVKYKITLNNPDDIKYDIMFLREKMNILLLLILMVD